MPRRLRPTAETAPDAILVGDPGRALLLAQELLGQPKMSNHARGLWGYYGQTPDGRALTIQSTGMGGPSAVVVLDDLAELGVERAVRVGSCVGIDEGKAPGALLLVRAAIAAGGSAGALGVAAGAPVTPDPELTERLLVELGGDCHPALVASVDAHPPSLAAGSGAVAGGV
jgi:uridine phosphorylase